VTVDGGDGGDEGELRRKEGSNVKGRHGRVELLEGRKRNGLAPGTGNSVRAVPGKIWLRKRQDYWQLGIRKWHISAQRLRTRRRTRLGSLRTMLEDLRVALSIS